MNSKKLAADKAVSFVRDGMVVGLGTGSTAYWAIEGIGERMLKEGLKLKAIATSTQSEKQARALGIPIVSFAEIDEIDLTIDGADEADPGKNLIKGGGGALLREKIVASNSKILIIVVDQSKLVKTLGKFPLPVEATIFGWEKTYKKLQGLGCVPGLRHVQAKPFVTDNGNYIIDCQFDQIPDPADLQQRINAITGVVDNGLFVGLTSKIIAGLEDGNTRIID
ncbi:MAG TPA: ribose-5-phosphate isomerase RpiA [Puia sp.]|nr:ribose-5-phosphate isomerase RpiA [Puia sp.]